MAVAIITESAALVFLISDVDASHFRSRPNSSRTSAGSMSTSFHVPRRFVGSPASAPVLLTAGLREATGRPAGMGLDPFLEG